ncbi:MAG: hypothetical protein SangKO_100030 [Sandaracinaceae bacterium]
MLQDAFEDVGRTAADVVVWDGLPVHEAIRAKGTWKVLRRDEENVSDGGVEGLGGTSQLDLGAGRAWKRAEGLDN